MNTRSLLSMLALVFSLVACSGPTRFAIQGYPGVTLPPTETFTVQSQNGWMMLDKLDGKKGKFIPLASGPGAYAGFDLHLLPGKHLLEVHCWIEPSIYSGAVYSDTTTVEVEGQAGELYVVSCTPEGKRMHYEVHRITTD